MPWLTHLPRNVSTISEYERTDIALNADKSDLAYDYGMRTIIELTIDAREEVRLCVRKIRNAIFLERVPIAQEETLLRCHFAAECQRKIMVVLTQYIDTKCSALIQ